MKIAIICPHFYPHIGGVENVVMQVASYLAVNGHEVVVLTQRTDNKSPKKERRNNFDIIRFETFGIGDLQISISLYKYLKDNSKYFDIVHAHNYHSFPALCAALTKSVPIVLSPHYHGGGHTLFTDIIHYPYKYVGNYIFSRTNLVTSNTISESKLIKKHFPATNDPTVIPLAIDFESILKTKRQKKLPYILTVGRLERYKKVDQTIRALQYLESDICLKIIGSGPEKSALVNLAAELNLENRVQFLENVSRAELFGLLKSAKAYITMSAMETYGLSLLEAIASNIGVVASDIPAHRELISMFSVKNVLLLKPDTSSRNLANSVTASIDRPSSVNGKLTSWKFTGEQTLRVYKNILKNDHA